MSTSEIKKAYRSKQQQQRLAPIATSPIKKKSRKSVKAVAYSSDIVNLPAVLSLNHSLSDKLINVSIYSFCFRRDDCMLETCAVQRSRGYRRLIHSPEPTGYDLIKIKGLVTMRVIMPKIRRKRPRF
jgi:hypothetical protein